MDFNMKNEKLWFGLAFALAITVRLLRLGEVPLSEAEAAWALQSFDLVRGLPFDFDPNPAYVNLTALVFFLLQASNFAARLVPALAGAALTLAPFFFRDRLGGRVALLLAFVLAFEPGLLALSRQADGPILAVSFFILAWGVWRSNMPRLAGFLAGLALLSGSALWLGLLGLLLAFALARIFAPGDSDLSFKSERARAAAYFAGGTYLLLGSLFLLAPGGLGAGLSGLLGIFTSLLTPGGVPVWLPLLALLFYQFPAVVLALVALGRLFARRDPLVIFLGIWLLAALLIAILPPSRQVGDLAWALLPLWALAALEAARWLEPVRPVVELQVFASEENPDEAELRPVTISSGLWETLGMAILTAVLLVFAWLNFSAAVLVTFPPETAQLRWLLTAATLAMLVLSVALVAFGWSASASFKGFAWGGLSMMVIYLVAMASFAANLRPLPTVEMWPAGPQSPAAYVIRDQMNEISQFSHGANASLEVVLVETNSSALRWLLRDWRVTQAQAISVDAVPELILMPANTLPPELEPAYRGASFHLQAYPAWEQASLDDWMRWIINHTLPQGQENILLWARGDLFPDAQNPGP
jgi:hypothetical protein